MCTFCISCIHSHFWKIFFSFLAFGYYISIYILRDSLTIFHFLTLSPVIYWELDDSDIAHESTQILRYGLAYPSWANQSHHLPELLLKRLYFISRWDSGTISLRTNHEEIEWAIVICTKYCIYKHQQLE